MYLYVVFLVRSFIICTLPQVSLERSSKGDREYSTNEERRNAYTGKPEEKRLLERSRRMWVSNIKIDLRDRMAWFWTGLISLRVGTSGRLL
jgi:hypothetical protein